MKKYNDTPAEKMITKIARWAKCHQNVMVHENDSLFQWDGTGISIEINSVKLLVRPLDFFNDQMFKINWSRKELPSEYRGFTGLYGNWIASGDSMLASN